MKKRILSLLLVCVLLLSLMPTAAFAKEVTDVPETARQIGDGFYQSGETYATSDEFYISNLNGLKLFRDIINKQLMNSEYYPTALRGNLDSTNQLFPGKTVKLLADIDLNNEEWEPIGNQYDFATKAELTGKPFFYGTFDGQNHTISNLKIHSTAYNASKKDGAGLFGRCQSTASFKNLTIKNVDIQASSYAGALCGNYCNSGVGVVENVHVTGTINITGGNSVGGLFGIAAVNLTNSSLIAAGEGGNIGSATGWQVGGVVGAARAGSSISATVKNLTVSAGSSTPKVGGVVGTVNAANVSVTNCTLDTVTVNGADTAKGKIVGCIEAANCTVTENSPKAPGQAGTVNETAVVGWSIAGTLAAGGVTGGTFEALPDSYIAAGYEKTANSTTPETWTVSPQPGYFKAKIGETYYATLAAALAEVENGETIQMLVDSVDEALPNYGTTKAFTLKGIADGYTCIKGAAASAGAGLQEANVTFENIEWTDSFQSRSMSNVTFKNCKFTGDTYGVYYGYATGKWTFEDCKFTQKGKYAVHFDEGKGVTVEFKNCQFCGKLNGLEAGYANVVNFTDCTFDGGTAGESGKYIAEIKLRADVNFTNCTFTKKFAEGISASCNADDNGINIVNGFTYSFYSCKVADSETPVFDIVHKLGENSYARYYEYIAAIGSNKYYTLADAIKAVPADGTKTTITMIADVGTEEDYAEFAAVYASTVAKGQNIVLDLAGKKIYAKTTVNGETCFIRVENGGTLCIKDSSNSKNGCINYLDGKDNTGGFVVCSAGKLTLESGTLENKTTCVSSAIQGAIDVHANEWGTPYTDDTTFTMTGGVLKSVNDNTLRVYDSSQTGSDKVNFVVDISGGEIYGADAVFVMRDATTAYDVSIAKNHYMNPIAITVSGGTFSTKNGVRVVGTAGVANPNASTPITINITGGTFNTTDTEKYRYAGVAFQESYGWTSTSASTKNLRTYVTVSNPSAAVAKIGTKIFYTVSEAISAAQDGDTITLLADIDSTNSGLEAGGWFGIGKSLTIDGAGSSGRRYAITTAGTHMFTLATADKNQTFTLKNCIVNQNNPTADSGYVVYTAGNAKIVIDNCEINSASRIYNIVSRIEGDGYEQCRDGVLVFTDNVVNAAAVSYFPWMNAGSVMTGNTFNNIGNARVGSVVADATGGAQITVSGNTFKNCTKNGLFAINDVALETSLCIKNNVYTNVNTVLKVESNTTLSADSEIINASGKAIVADGGTLTISGGKYLGQACAYEKGSGTLAISGGYFSSEIADGDCASAYHGAALSDSKSAEGYDADYAALAAAGFGYKPVLYTEKQNDTKAVIIYEDENGKTAQQTEFHNDTEDAVESAKKGTTNENTAKAIIKVESGGIAADIDDSIQVIAITDQTNEVVADPGYILDEPTVNVSEGTTTYTAEALAIGYTDTAKTEATKGNGKTEVRAEASSKTVETAEEVGATEEVEAIAATVSEAVTTSDSILASAKEAAETINQGIAAKAINQGTSYVVKNEATGAEIPAKNVSVFVETYYQTEITEDNTEKTEKEEKNFTLEITPMYQVYATILPVTTATTLDNLTVGTDTAVVGEPEKLDMTGKTITMRVKMPADFVSSTEQSVYVTHIKDDASKSYYTASVEQDAGDFYAVFTNPDGFSQFTFALVSSEPVRRGIVGSSTYSVTVAESAHGTVSTSTKTSYSDNTITLTVAPESGWALDTITVKQKNGNAITLTTVTAGTKYTFRMPEADVTVAAAFKAGTTENAQSSGGAAAETKTDGAAKTVLQMTIGKLAAKVNGAEKLNDVAPIIRKNRTMLPARFVAENLGAKAEWDETARTVTVTSADVKTVIVLVIGSDEAKVNGEAVKLDSAAFIENNRTYTPVRFIAEQLGATVSWNEAAREVTIEK